MVLAVSAFATLSPVAPAVEPVPEPRRSALIFAVMPVTVTVEAVTGTSMT